MLQGAGLGFAALVVAAACGSSDTATTTNNPPPEPPEPPPVTMPPVGDIPKQWWSAADNPCPSGMTVRGKPPPDGHSVWCANDRHVRTGPYTTFYKTGQKNSEGWEHRNNRVGPWTYWYADGTLRLQATHLPNNGLTGAYAHWSPTGELIGQYELPNGTGTATLWTDSGDVSARGPMVGGQRDGTWTTFHASGHNRETTHYRRGRRAGATTMWDNQGRKVGTGSYADGKRTGEWVRFDPDSGKPTVASTFRADRGIHTVYYQEGTPLGAEPAELGACVDDDGIASVVAAKGGGTLDKRHRCIARPRAFPGVVLLGSFANDRGCMPTGSLMDCKRYDKAWPSATALLARVGWSDANAENRAAIAMRYVDQVATLYSGAKTSDPAPPAVEARDDGGVVVEVWVNRPAGMRRGRIADLRRYLFTADGNVTMTNVSTLDEQN